MLYKSSSIQRTIAKAIFFISKSNFLKLSCLRANFECDPEECDTSTERNTSPTLIARFKFAECDSCRISRMIGRHWEALNMNEALNKVKLTVIAWEVFILTCNICIASPSLNKSPYRHG